MYTKQCSCVVYIIALTVTVDAVESGTGELEIVINDGEVPCQVDHNGARKYVATFVPEDCMVHVVRILFNGVEVPGQQHCIQTEELNNCSVIINNIFAQL